MNTKISSKELTGHTIILEIDGRRVLKRKPIVFDCGACIGKFTDKLLTNVRATVYMYEPNADLFNYLRSKYNDYPRVTVFNKAIDSRVGTKRFYIGNIKKSSSLISSHRNLSNIMYNVSTTTLDNEIDRYIDIVKLDIEGSEIDVLMNTTKETLNNIGQLTVEYHLHSDIDEYTKERIEKCEEFLFDNDFIKYHEKEMDVCYFNERLLDEG